MLSTMMEAPRLRVRRGFAKAAVTSLAAVLMSSCGGGGQCPGASGLPLEPAPRQAELDRGGVQLESLTQALAVARCNYLSRCFALADYVANECVDDLTGPGTWSYQICGLVSGNLECTARMVTYDYPSTALRYAVYEGAVQYDPQRAAQCVAALLAEGCNGAQLVEQIPECVGVFTCPAATGSGSAEAPDGGTADGGSACPTNLFVTGAFTTCATDADCANVAGYPQGPYCVGGICTASRCGLTGYDGCISFAGVGQPCQGNAPSPIVDDNLTTTPTETCAPGLACQFWPADGGIGTCAVPQDVGGKCTQATECKPGLVCGCGDVCQIPPSTGPCVAGLCEIGVAYCDFATNTCRPGPRPGT